MLARAQRFPDGTRLFDGPGMDSAPHHAPQCGRVPLRLNDIAARVLQCEPDIVRREGREDVRAEDNTLVSQRLPPIARPLAGLLNPGHGKIVPSRCGERVHKKRCRRHRREMHHLKKIRRWGGLFPPARPSHLFSGVTVRHWPFSSSAWDSRQR